MANGLEGFGEGFKRALEQAAANASEVSRSPVPLAVTPFRLRTRAEEAAALVIRELGVPRAGALERADWNARAAERLAGLHDEAAPDPGRAFDLDRAWSDLQRLADACRRELVRRLLRRRDAERAWLVARSKTEKKREEAERTTRDERRARLASAGLGAFTGFGIVRSLAESAERRGKNAPGTGTYVAVMGFLAVFGWFVGPGFRGMAT